MASQRLHVRYKLVRTQLAVACTLCAGMGWKLAVRGQRSCGEELALVGHILIYRKPSIINLLLRKWEHVVICRSQVLLIYVSGFGFYLCREKLLT